MDSEQKSTRLIVKFEKMLAEEIKNYEDEKRELDEIHQSPQINQ